ncbi:hypothetical protein HUW46_09176 [Amycolatopsis sp. CA-230715]|nr:hypothetical protein HUW46_09176 [Amycolatopsis sp. CA-230715]
MAREFLILPVKADYGTLQPASRTRHAAVHVASRGSQAVPVCYQKNRSRVHG